MHSRRNPMEQRFAQLKQERPQDTRHDAVRFSAQLHLTVASCVFAALDQVPTRSPQHRVSVDLVLECLGLPMASYSHGSSHHAGLSQDDSPVLLGLQKAHTMECHLECGPRAPAVVVKPPGESECEIFLCISWLASALLRPRLSRSTPGLHQYPATRQRHGLRED